MADCELEKRPDGVGVITMNRPESLNSISADLVALFARHLDECEADPAVRCVAVTGAGRAFCAGGDIKAMLQRNSGEGPEVPSDNVAVTLEFQIRLLRQQMEGVSYRIHTLRKPVVALINGAATGAGLSIALACDIRIAGDRARFGTAFRNMALSGDYGISFSLQRVVGPTLARELLFSGELFDAERAKAIGMLNRVVPQDDLMAEGLAYCSELAAGPTAALGRIKANLAFAETAPLRDVLGHEAANLRTGAMAPDSKEAVKAFVDKRPPNFSGE